MLKLLKSPLPGIALAAIIVMIAMCGVRSSDVSPANTLKAEDLVVSNSSTLTGQVTLGDVTHQELVNGPTLQSFAIPSTSYAYGEVNREEISGVVPAFPADLFVHVIRNSATADTTAHTQRSGGLAVEVTSSRTAGALDLQNIAFECDAQNGQVNNCIEALHGDVVVDNGNLEVNRRTST